MAEQEKEEKSTKLIDWLKLNGEPVTEPEEFCEWIDNQVFEHPVVKNHHGKWKEILAWEEGNQYSLWNDHARRVLPVELNVRQTKLVVNVIKPLLETIEGKLNFDYMISGKPNSGEDRDIRGAEVATKMLDHNDHTVGLDELLEELKEDLLRTGNACMKWWWDKSLHGLWAPKLGGGVDKKNKQKDPGEVQSDVVPIFNIRVDPTARRPRDCQWVLEIKEVNRADLLEIFELYGIDLKDIDPTLEFKDLEESKDRYSIVRNVDDRENQHKESTYIIKEYWEKSNRDYKNGRLILTCGPYVLYAGKNPSPEAELPYFFYYYKKKKYSFWANGPAYYVQDLQRNINRTVSLIAEHIEAWRPKMAIPEGALKRHASMTVGPFELVEIDTTKGDPRPLQMPELSQQVMAHRDFLIASVDRVSNVHEVSYSRLPQYASRAPASLYSMMLEQENIKLAPMVKMVNKTLIDQATFRLKLMGQHYKRKRMVQIVGVARSTSVDFFDASDLNNNYDVRLERGVTINKSSTIQTRLLLELWEKGLLKDADRYNIIKLLDFGTAENEIRSDVIDQERARRENYALLHGDWDNLPDYKPFNLDVLEAIGMPADQLMMMKQQVDTAKVSKVYKHDDHALHLDQHTTLVKSEEWTQVKPELQIKMLAHIEEHYFYFQQEQRASQMAQQGPPPAKPPGVSSSIPQSAGPGGTSGEPMIEGFQGAQGG
jgi:hypothetical protein